MPTKKPTATATKPTATAAKPSGTTGYLTVTQFEQQKERAEGEKRFQIVRGLQFDTQAETLKSDAKQVGVYIAQEGLNQTQTKLQIAQTKTATERLHLEAALSDKVYLETEYQLKGELWELKLENHRLAISAGRKRLEALKADGFEGVQIPSINPAIEVDY